MMKTFWTSVSSSSIGLIFPPRLRSAVGENKGRLFAVAKTGPRPMASYGDKVMGFTDHELLLLRRGLLGHDTGGQRQHGG